MHVTSSSRPESIGGGEDWGHGHLRRKGWVLHISVVLIHIMLTFLLAPMFLVVNTVSR